MAASGTVTIMVEGRSQDTTRVVLTPVSDAEVQVTVSAEAPFIANGVPVTINTNAYRWADGTWNGVPEWASDDAQLARGFYAHVQRATGGEVSSSARKRALTFVFDQVARWAAENQAELDAAGEKFRLGEAAKRARRMSELAAAIEALDEERRALLGGGRIIYRVEQDRRQGCHVVTAEGRVLPSAPA